MTTAAAIPIANAALALTGDEPITAFNEENDSAVFLSLVYEAAVGDALSAKPWRFAMRQSALNRLAAEPVGRWGAAYQVPNDCLIVRAVTVDGGAIAFDRYDDMLFCDAAVTDVVVLDHTVRLGEEDWPPAFRACVIDLLAADIALGLAERPALHDRLLARAGEKIARLASTEAQGRTTPRLDTSLFLRARRAGWRR